MRSAAGRARVLSNRAVTILALLAGSAVLLTLLTGRDDMIETETLPEDRGYYLNDATLTELGVDGRARVVVHADTVEQQLADESVRLQDIELDYTTDRDGVWHVTANRGRMPADRSILHLTGDVRVAGSPESSGGRVTILTDELAYETRASVIQTAAPVAVQFGTHHLNGRGLRIALNDGTLRLDSNVDGTFIP